MAMEATYFYSTPYVNKLAEFAKLRDTFAGNERVKDAGAIYLPRPSAMSDDGYTNYKLRALFYPVVERTVRGLLGVIFHTPPTFTLPQKLAPWQESMTPEGDSLMESFRQAVREALHMGRHGILLDMPKDADVNALPFISHYTAENITAWERRFHKGHRRLTRVMLRETTDTDAADTGRFLELVLDLNGATPVYRVTKWEVKFTRGAGNTLTIDAVAREDHTPLVQGKPLDYIPFYFLNPYDNKADLAKSPMLDLADANISHYQLQADYRQTLFMVAQPTPYIIGDIPDERVPKKIGASAFWVLPPEVTDLGMLEYSGAGIESLRNAGKDVEGYMAALGAKLVHRQNQPETAEAVKTNSRDELSVIQSVVMTCVDGYKAALRDAAKMVGAGPKSTDVVADTDFAEGRMDPAMLTAMVATWQSGGISREVYHRNLQRGDIMPVDRTVEDEQAATDEESAERQAKAQEAMEAQAAAAGADEETDPAPPAKGKPPGKPKGKP